MANKTAERTVYPPRYFVGFVDLHPRSGGERRRLRFYNAVLIPLSLHHAALFTGAPGSPYYRDGMNRLLRPGWLEEIQYAISCYDARTDSYQVEKFNHKFAPETALLEKRGSGWLISTAARQSLFRTYRIDDVLDNMAPCVLPVIQFIA